MFHINDVVRVIDDKKNLVKEGLIVAMTSHGANIYQPKCEYPFVDSVEDAEWFPFSSPKIKIMASRTKRFQND